MTEHAVVIAGGGPTGLMLAGELALAGVDAVIVERRPNQEFEGTRARGIQSRTIEVLDQRGIAGRFLAEGQAMQIGSFAGVRLDISAFPSRHPYGLALLQTHIERLLAGWVDELGVPIVREREVTGFSQGEAGVDVELSDGRSLRAQFLAGCDGGRSLIRKTAGIAFPGWDPSVSSLIAEAEMREEPEWGIRYDEHGTQAIGKLDDGRVGVVVTEPYAGQPDDPTQSDLSRALVAVWGTDFGVHSPSWISRFTDMTRQAASYRAGRVLLAGDAAHVHYPIGGQGLNLGVQDAVNLGWKLAQVVKGTSPDARVLKTTMAQTVLARGDARIDALRGTIAEMLSMDDARDHVGAMLAGLDIGYDLGDGHPLLGRRMPDIDLKAAGGALRMYALLHEARPVLLNLGVPGTFDIAPWADRIQLVDATYDGPWEIPAIGEVAAPASVLIRPDGHVAWVGDGTDEGLTHALARWFGAPT